MAMVELAGHPLKKPVTLAELAEAQEITVPYLEQIFSKLKHAGLVTSVRGPGGGYILAKPAADTRIYEIVEAVEESIKMTRCQNSSGHGKTGCMATRARCLTHDLWEGMEQHIREYLDSISLADIRNKKPLAHKALAQGLQFN
jgi:Rrf2 family transcriptional regulator, iron-sulfur cluster assembly transcription factor